MHLGHLIICEKGRTGVSARLIHVVSLFPAGAPAGRTSRHRWNLPHHCVIEYLREQDNE
ncbi:MAG: hypothetical protein HY673_18505 [Chloroflexi bacterium]|nr:hypothetical protein [Chloroflexota bacterium]